MKKYRSIVIFFFFFIFVFGVIAAFSLIGNIISNSIPVTLANVKINTDINLIIDPGHGGEDGGAIANGVVEKDLNLEISKKLRDFFFLTGINTHMTRTEDVLLYKAGEENRKKYHDISNRIQFVNLLDNPVLISIHQNKFEIPKYKGLQVYYSKNHPFGENLAEIIQNNARNHLAPENKREIKAADSKIRLLNSLDVPAVLVECGFISNEQEAHILSDSSYQNKLAFVLFISSLSFLEE